MHLHKLTFLTPPPQQQQQQQQQRYSKLVYDFFSWFFYSKLVKELHLVKYFDYTLCTSNEVIMCKVNALW